MGLTKRQPGTALPMGYLAMRIARVTVSAVN